MKGLEASALGLIGLRCLPLALQRAIASVLQFLAGEVLFFGCAGSVRRHGSISVFLRSFPSGPISAEEGRLREMGVVPPSRAPARAHGPEGSERPLVRRDRE